MNTLKYFKYHALGNDYIVLRPEDIEGELDARRIRLICHRHFGPGSDGILLGPIQADGGRIGLRIFNPDGSEAEKSGNGLRIFSRFLWDLKIVGEDEFEIETPGGLVRSTVSPGGRSVRVEMGVVSFQSESIPVAGPAREVIEETIQVKGRSVTFCAATVGNPHCVIPQEAISSAETIELGPLIETDERFPNRINVQFMKVLDRSNIRIEIWERGAGYTLASGSSSSAAAAVAHRLGLCDGDIAVHMPGGRIDISIGKDYDITMTGPVTRVAEGEMFEELFGQDLNPGG